MNTKQQTVLVADDTKEVRESIACLLKQHGFHVECASNGIETLDKIRQLPELDAVVLDLLMPEMDGLDVLSELQRYGPRCIPVVILTALSSVSDVNRGIQYGAALYITKPISPTALLSALRYVTKSGTWWDLTQDEAALLQEEGVYFCPRKMV